METDSVLGITTIDKFQQASSTFSKEVGSRIDSCFRQHVRISKWWDSSRRSDTDRLHRHRVRIERFIGVREFRQTALSLSTCGCAPRIIGLDDHPDVLDGTMEQSRQLFSESTASWRSTRSRALVFDGNMVIVLAGIECIDDLLEITYVGLAMTSTTPLLQFRPAWFLPLPPRFNLTFRNHGAEISAIKYNCCKLSFSFLLIIIIQRKIARNPFLEASTHDAAQIS